MSIFRILTFLLLLSLLLVNLEAPSRTAGASWTALQKTAHRDREIAARFAPIFYQALGESSRSDYITNFDFDGDWRGDNNWDNSHITKFHLKAYIYYAVTETATHYFIHYGVFHARDYKGGEHRGIILSELLREGAKRGGKYDPTGLVEEATLAHENDMEGALVVIKKNGSNLDEAQVVFVETLRHNRFSGYLAGELRPGFGSIKLEGRRPLLYVEPKGHGIEAYVGDQKQIGKKSFLRYAFAGIAEDQADLKVNCVAETGYCSGLVSYDLTHLSALWDKAQGEANATYGEVCDYGEVSLSTSLNGLRPTEKKINIGRIGCAFLGKVGGENMARPPWAWFDRDRRNEPLGRWFFDPATTIKRDFGLDDEFSTVYVRLPFWTK